MTQISRTFDSAAQAKAAVAELKQEGLHRVELIEVPDRRGPSGGGAVVRVEPPFGSALAATAILDRHRGKEAAAGAAKPQPVPAASPPQQPAKADTPSAPGPTRQAAASAAAPSRAPSPQEPRQELRTGPRTLSEWLGIPLLIDSNTFFSGFPLLLRPSRKTPTAKPE